MQLHIHNDRLIEQGEAINNQYFLLLAVGFFAAFIKDFIFQYHQLAIFDIVLLVGCIFYAFVPDKTKLNVDVRLVIYGAILIFVLYFLLLLRFESITLFYIPLTFSLGIYFDLNKNKFIVILLAFLIVVSIVLYYTLNVHLSSGIYSPDYKTYTDILNIVDAVSLSLFFIYIIIKRNQLLFFYQQEFNEMLKLNAGKRLDVDTFDEFKQLIYSDYTVFYLQFKEKYPIFIHRIEFLAPNLVAEEMKVVILMYMNYSTKEIAKITNSSFKAIQAKKHRIRKKLNVPGSVDILDFLRSL